jgi:hypothetical protein
MPRGKFMTVEQQLDFAISISNYEISDRPLPELLAKAVKLIEPDILGGLEVKVWEDPSNEEVHFIPPSQVGFPNNPDALRDPIDSAITLNSTLFAQHGIEGDLMVLTFIILHERKHLDHYTSNRITAWAMPDQKTTLENEANEYAVEQLVIIKNTLSESR